MTSRDVRRPSPPAGGSGRHAETSRGAVGLLAAAFLLSGTAGLIHEVVWVRLLGHVFGVTAFAVGTVLAAYMGGLAIGAFLAGRHTSRRPNPARTYAWLEVGIGIFALAVPFLLDAFEPIYGWMWRRFHASFAAFSALRFVVAGGLLLAPTVMMGATLPLLVEHFARRSGRRAAPEWLYTVNLAGASLGVASAGFLLLPALGVRATIVAGSAINVIVGLVVLAWSRATGPAAAVAGGSPGASRPGRGPGRIFLAAAFLSGFACLAGQVAWTRLTSLLVGSTTYAFSTVLLVVLASLACGSAWASRTRPHPAGDDRRLAVLSTLSAIALAASVAAVHQWPSLYWMAFDTLRPGSLTAVVGLNMTALGAILTPPMLLAGTLFPLTLAAVRTGEPGAAARSVGVLCAINTLGAILGSILAGFILVPWLGSSGTLKGIVCVTALFGAGLAARSGSRRLRALVLGGAAAAMLAVLALPAWDPKLLNAAIYEPRPGIDPRDKNPEDRVVYHREGPTATVVVLDRPPRSRSLRINGRVNGSNEPRDIATNVLLAQIPLLLSDRGERALVIGLGTGVTAGAALQSPARQVTVIELEPAVVEASRLFDAESHAPLDDPRMRLIEDDARHILVASEDDYDVIISEPSHPWVSGVANLFTRDFFELAGRRLHPEGLFAQWLQTYQITPGTFRTILGTFQSVFPEVLIFRSAGSDLILIGSKRPVGLSLAGLEGRFGHQATRLEMARIGMARPESLLAHFVTGPGDVRAMIAGAAINTDDNMMVEFQAPAGVLAPDSAFQNAIFMQMVSTPVESVLIDPELLLGRRDSLAALVEALAARRWPAERYRRMLELP